MYVKNLEILYVLIINTNQLQKYLYSTHIFHWI
jgi:hypothetical protein